MYFLKSHEFARILSMTVCIKTGIDFVKMLLCNLKEIIECVFPHDISICVVPASLPQVCNKHLPQACGKSNLHNYVCSKLAANFICMVKWLRQVCSKRLLQACGNVCCKLAANVWRRAFFFDKGIFQWNKIKLHINLYFYSYYLIYP